MLCLYCHDHEHSKYTEADQYGSTVVAGEDAQKSVGEAKYNPFADLKAMMNEITATAGPTPMFAGPGIRI
jgi:hypothetical protein